MPEHAKNKGLAPPREQHDRSPVSSSPVQLSALSSRQHSRNTSPFTLVGPNEAGESSSKRHHNAEDLVDPSGLDDWDDSWGDAERASGDEPYADMPSDLRPSLTLPTDARSHQPLLSENGKGQGYEDAERPRMHSRRRTFTERDPEELAAKATRTRYIYAGFFLLLSLVSFVIQTETAVYIAEELGWKKSYCMLYFTHGSWSLLWPVQLLILRLQKWGVPWEAFWRQHVQTLRQTAQMIQHQSLHLHQAQQKQSPLRYILRTVALVTCTLTMAGLSWYVAVNLTTASDLTAIYNCSAFFAYAFSVPLLKEKVRWSKVIAVAVAIVGVLVVAYGGTNPPKHGSKSGGGTGGSKTPEHHEPPARALGNLVIAIGSVLYGLYEVLYKKVACPPDGCSPGRGVIFANTFGSMIGLFTLTVLWIPLPILHILGWETFELPQGKAAWMLLISVLSNATFSGSFLVLISLTSPVLSSVAALLTIFIVAIVDELLPEPMKQQLTPAAITGGLLIIGAFLVLSWATYREMDEERRKKLEEESEDESVLSD